MARGSISKDGLEYERRGRVVGENHHREAIRARARELLRVGGRSGGGRPASGASLAAFEGRGSSNQTILKVIGWTKTPGAPLAQAKYAARTREQDPPEASLTSFNEEGRSLHGAAVEAEIRSWELMPGSENLSPAARRAGREERAAMTESERYDRRQAVHLIFSIPAHARADADRLDRAVREGLAETLGDGGFRYVYTIHTDHSSRPHAHIIAKVQSEPFVSRGEMKTRQLRLGPSELEATRQVLTRHAQEQGLNVIASRREDRAELREEILTGRAPLRDNKKRHQYELNGQTRQGRTFERQAPHWYAAHGHDYERRRLAAAGAAPSAPPTVETAAPERGGGLLGRLLGRLGVGERKAEDALNDPAISAISRITGRAPRRARRGSARILRRPTTTPSAPPKASASCFAKRRGLRCGRRTSIRSPLASRPAPLAPVYEPANSVRQFGTPSGEPGWRRRRWTIRSSPASVQA
jgi:hypothetical protein